jgi:hypothetical protein
MLLTDGSFLTHLDYWQTTVKASVRHTAHTPHWNAPKQFYTHLNSAFEIDQSTLTFGTLLNDQGVVKNQSGTVLFNEWAVLPEW